MGIQVSVFGAEKESDEYLAAIKLRKIIQETTPDSAIGEIVLFASATLYGQAVKDVDLMMLGNIQNYSLKTTFTNGDDELVTDEVNIKSFCTVIEVKRHDISGVVLNGTDFYVKYGKGLHCVTQQSNKQKIAAKNFFETTLSFSPFITNLIWFTQVTPNEIRGLLTNDKKRMPANVIGAEFDFKDMMQLLLLQRYPYKSHGKYYLDANYEHCTVSDFQKTLSLFSKSKAQMGELTRKKIEMISSKSFVENNSIEANGKVSIYRGRAGTGKTVGLIQTAIKLVDEEQARVLILTYNKALVSDIRRLFALAEMPDMFDESCVYISTLQSYFYRLSNTILYEGKMSGDKYIDNYDSIIKELKEFLEDEDAIGLAKEVMLSDDRLNWEYLLIDEAQDWSNAERDVVLKLFANGKIIIADGGNQFVRRGKVCDWNIIQERNNIKLKYCLRQKVNIISFLNQYTQKLGMSSGKIIGSDKMLGGKVLIVEDANMYETFTDEMYSLVEHGNIAYDMLFLVPHSLVKKTAEGNKFSLTRQFEDNRIFIWDGTSIDKRDGYTVNTDEVRVFQYDSARGLEGWTVVCMDFDVFLEEKEGEYEEGDVDSLMLESPEERRKKFIYNWAMIPLTRAIDTLVITLKNPCSGIGTLIREIAQNCEDYVFVK